MFNKAILIGRLTKDPEQRMTPTGVAVVTFSLAVNRNFASANGQKETDFFNCVAYRKTAEFIARYVKKGNALGVEGRIQNRSYDGQDGVKRYITEIVCETAFFVESKSTQTGDRDNYNYQPQPQQSGFNLNQQAPLRNNLANNPMFAENDNAKSQDQYIEDNPDVNISEDDLPF